MPTAVVAVWCVAWQLPGHKAVEIARLRQQTGMEVALAGLATRGREPSAIAA